MIPSTGRNHNVQCAWFFRRDVTVKYNGKKSGDRTGVGKSVDGTGRDDAKHLDTVPFRR